MALDRFYKEVVQHVKPWAPAPPKIRDNETAASDEPIQADGNLVGEGTLVEKGVDQLDAPSQIRPAQSLAAFPI
jgi:hypothetical protein